MVQLPILTNFYPKKGHLEFSGAYFLVVSLAAVFSIVTQRSSSETNFLAEIFEKIIFLSP